MSYQPLGTSVEQLAEQLAAEAETILWSVPTRCIWSDTVWAVSSSPKPSPAVVWTGGWTRSSPSAHRLAGRPGRPWCRLSRSCGALRAGSPPRHRSTACGCAHRRPPVKSGCLCCRASLESERSCRVVRSDEWASEELAQTKPLRRSSCLAISAASARRKRHLGAQSFTLGRNGFDPVASPTNDDPPAALREDRRGFETALTDSFLRIAGLGGR
jgi:hypothetical protein